jgi:hypothetical protein
MRRALEPVAMKDNKISVHVISDQVILNTDSKGDHIHNVLSMEEAFELAKWLYAAAYKIKNQALNENP